MESGIQNRIFKSGIQPLPESTDVESGIHRHGIWNQQCGFGNPRLTSWITLNGATKCSKDSNWMTHYPLNNSIAFGTTYPLKRDSSGPSCSKPD